MKLKSSLPTVVWVLLGLLAISAFVFIMGSTETTAFPSADSYRPSGTRALFDLLTRQGYQVETTEDPSPQLDPKTDVLVGFEVEKPTFDLTNPTQIDTFATKHPFIQDYVDGGGKAAFLKLDYDFQSASDTADGHVANLKLAADPRVDLKVNVAEPSFGTSPGEGIPLAQTSQQYDSPPADLVTLGQGKVLVVNDGIIATNRFIGVNDNAEQLVRWLRTVASPGSRLIFYEWSFGNGSSPTVFTVLGRWSSAAWLQLVFLFVVIIYTLGKPFGYPDEVKKKQRGARDLVDAVAMLYRRGKAGGIVLRRVYEDADHELRTRLKLPSDASTAERDRYLPQELVDALHRIESWSTLRIRPGDALDQVQKLDRLMTEFLGERRRPGRAKRTKTL